ILGSTGVGKSTSVSLILSKVLEDDDKTRIMLIDPHNEYKRAFGEKAHIVSPTNLRLPFWLFNFEEFTDAVFRGRPVVDEEVAALAEFIPAAKTMFASRQTEGASTLSKREADSSYTVDTPIPYRLSDLIGLIDKELGSLENKGDRPAMKKLKGRIESISRDAHYQFMFANLAVDDSMGEILQNLFRIPHQGKPITILELAGFPSEVVNSVVSVVCRMAFDIGLWSNSRIPVLVVAEEAHRYVPADRSLGFGPTRRAISRIAKEGRKYGVYLGIITQRPAELDPTIISQCSTIFAMRMANESDHAIIRSAVSDAAASILAFLPSIGNREAIAFGEGVAMPMRMRFMDLEESKLPSRQDIVQQDDGTSEAIDDNEILQEIVQKWRTAEMRENRRATRFSTEDDDVEASPTLRRAIADQDSETGDAPGLRRDEPAAPTLRRSGFGSAGGGFGR
ncbi:MAG: ATP-binding protein, partial [Alphaproteobacteria bacterium]